MYQSVHGFRFTGRQSFSFPIGNWRRRYNSAALPRSLWSYWYCFPNLNLISPSKSNRWHFSLCSPPRRQWLIVHENDCITVHCMILSYEDLYFQVITVMFFKRNSQFLCKWFPAPWKNSPYAYASGSTLSCLDLHGQHHALFYLAFYG